MTSELTLKDALRLLSGKAQLESNGVTVSTSAALCRASTRLLDHPVTMTRDRICLRAPDGTTTALFRIVWFAELS